MKKEIATIKKKLTEELKPEFIHLGLKILERQGEMYEDDTLEDILDRFNETFDCQATLSDIIPQFSLDLDTVDVQLTLKHSQQFHANFLHDIKDL